MLLSQKNILELGCGSGRLFPTFIQEGVENITGIDISDEMILKAKTKHPSLNVKIKEIFWISKSGKI
ncbi:MAG: class I SAM-dependent methyltransferase [Saprospiraceae bacterium]|nr:class I SAM-dependent methyltransferase [Saprospiraceae bacterium]